MTDKIDVIYIAGIGHSGSTLLGMKLGSENHNFFVGEVKHFDKSYTKYDCTCGKTLEDCEYWSGLNRSDWHQLLRRAKQVKGDKVDTLIDSSKDPSVLRRRLKNPNLNLSVVHLVRNPFNHLKRYGIGSFLSWFIAHPAIWLFANVNRAPYKLMTYNQLLDSDEDYDRKINQETYHLFTGNIPAVKNFSEIK